MATSLVVNGVSYPYPDTGDQSWGTVASGWAAAVTNGMLQKSGGAFTLTADANFGANFGLLSKYFTSQSASAASTGIVRLASTESISWRNNANGADIALAKNSSDQLTWAGVVLASSAGVVPIAAGGTGAVTKAAGFDALQPMTTLGDIVYGGASGTGTRLAGNITTTLKFLVQTGSGAASAAPSWAALKAPTIQQFLSSSGTYTTPTSPAPLYIRIIAVGAGGGGGGGNSDGSGGGTGGNTTFGTTLIAANGGTGGAQGGGTVYSAAGTGGTASLGSGPIGIAIAGGGGQAGSPAVAAVRSPAGMGGVSALGGAGVSGAGTGGTGATNSGSGGGGGSSGANNVSAGAGGGAGGYVDAIITAPAATYAYAVGAAGGAGGGGSSSSNGGAGAAGQITVYEYYQ